MNVKAYLVDRVSEEPVEGVSITVVDKDGKPLGPGTETDAKGFFSISSPLLDNPENKLMITHVDYATTINDPKEIYGEVYLENEPDMLDGLVFTFKKKAKEAIKQPSYLIPFILATASVVLLGIAIKKKYFVS